MSVREVVRTDDELRIREEAEFFPSAGEWLFGFRHIPLTEPRGGVLICSPVLAEFRKNYRQEFELGHRLAADGFAVQRFHYRGTGNSGGESADITLGSLREDAIAAAGRLTEVTSQPASVVVGTRLGAFVAVGVAERLEARALVMWEPLLDGSLQFREAFRARRLRDLRERIATSQSSEAPSKELLRTGRVDVLGYTIHRGLYESLIERKLEQELSSPPPRVLIIQIGGGTKRKASYELLADRWTRQGAAVHIDSIDREESWWLGEREDQVTVASDTLTDAVERTHDWIAEAMT